MKLQCSVLNRRRSRATVPQYIGVCCFVAATLLMRPIPAMARTVLLDVEHCDRIAAIDAAAPRLSWAMARDRHDTYHTAVASLTQDRSLLMRFSLDAIPPDQRIVHAELVVPVADQSGNEPRFYLWRLLAGWGPGVCHRYRYTHEGDREEKVEWTEPGARGISSDRATTPTDVVRVIEGEANEKVINVTEDVELWYEGRATNHGWLFSVEEPQVVVDLASPLWTTSQGWTLRITYEPRSE